jgi:hypothetical protein
MHIAYTWPDLSKYHYITSIEKDKKFENLMKYSAV